MVTNDFPRPFGRYTLLANLAQGGMGALYLGCQGEAGMEKLCVIKTVLPHLADKEYVARFRDEAKVVVRLSHGNLVPVFDAGLARTPGGTDELYLAMEYVHGKDLRAVWNQCARKGIAFPVDVAAYIARELARGLHHAHTAGNIKLVHRDVSPPNVLLAFSGEVKLTDFGLASSTLKTEKTAAGVVYGKVSYMSPEQARGEVLDGRTDMYAVAVILWELLTGKQLFPQNEPLLINKVRDPVIRPPSEAASRVPPQLDVIVMKALAKDRTLRYADCEELRAALAGFLAKTAPTTDNDRVAKFLEQLFGNEIADERRERQRLLDDLAERRARPVAVDGAQTASQPETVSLAPKEPPPGSSGIIGSYIDDRYLVKRLLGEGGMGLVYEAEHVEIGRRVAVKVLHAAYTRQAEVVARFRAEARAATRIGHPHIIEVLDSGTTVEGAVYFVMEYLDGKNLAQVLAKEGPLPAKRVIALARQICQALAAAHKAGIVHRDMKPENVLLITRDGRPDFVKVVDFGIAKTADTVTDRVGRLTDPGVAMGTPEYMAPEQAAGLPADHRVDIYAVGAILYELLTGRPPHQGGNIMEVLTKKATVAPTPIETLRPDAPRDLAGLVMRMLASQPQLRPSSMELLAQELGRLGGADNNAPVYTTAEQTDKLPRRRAPFIVAAAVLVTAVVGVTVVTLRGSGGAKAVASAPPPEPVAKAQAEALKAPPPEPEPAPEPEPEPVRATPVIKVAPVTVRRPAERPEPKPEPAKPDGRAEARRLLAEARAAATGGRFGQAESLYERVVTTGFERPAAIAGLAEIAFQKGNYPEAVRLGRRAIEAGGGVSARMVLGNALFRLKKYDEAIDAYREVLRVDSGHREARANLEAAEKKRGG